MQGAGILERFQNRYPKIIVNAPCYVTDDTLHHDLNVLETRLKGSTQRYADRVKEHSNILATNLIKSKQHVDEKDNSRLVYLIAL